MANETQGLSSSSCT